MGLLRSMLSLAILCVLLFVAFTVPIGRRTLVGHVVNIWSSKQAQELVDGVKKSGAPLVDRVKRGVEASLADDSSNEKNKGTQKGGDAGPIGKTDNAPPTANP